MSRVAKIGVAATVLLTAFIIYSTMGLAKVSCEVCVEFRGQRSCRPASGTTQSEAISTAANVACTDVTVGRDDKILCLGDTTKKTIRCDQ